MRSAAWIILALVLLTAAALVPPAALPVGSQQLTMAVWGMPFEDQLFRDGYARGFESLHPGWAVRYQRHTLIVEKYNAWHVQGRGADVMRLGIDYYHAFVDKGMLTPLNQFIRDPEVGLSEAEIADFFPEIWERLIVGDEIYALPADNAQYGLYYNRALFDRWNAAHPEERIEFPTSEWTWDDLARAARLLTIRDARGRTTQYGIMFDLWAWPFMAFLHQAGGTLWDEDATTTLIDSPQGVEALEYLVSVIPEDAPIKAIGLAESAASPAQLFKVGSLAMMLDGSWRAPNLELDNPDLDYAVAPLPRGRKRAVVSGSVLWGISAHSANPRKAWEMIKWMTSEEQALRYWDTLRVAPPALLSVVRSDAFRSTSGLVTPDGVVRIPPLQREHYADRAAWLEYAVTPRPETGEPPGFVEASRYQLDLQNAITAALVAAVRDGVDAQQALSKAADDVHQIIDRDRAAKGLPRVVRE